MNTLEKSLILGAATVASVAVINKVDAATNYGVYYTTSNLNLRTSMTTSSQKITLIPKGGKVSLVMKYSNGWSKVTYNNKTGFVSSQYLSKTTGNNNTTNPVNNNSVSSVAYTTELLNLRKGPGTGYGSILKIPKTASVSILGNTGTGWYKVKYNGYTGYVSSQYIVKTKPVQQNRSTQGVLKHQLIVISKTNRTLTYYKDGKLQRTFSCAVGAPSTQTPSNRYSIQNKIKNRPYYKEHIAGGDPRNPLGKRWMGLTPEYGIHGTNNENSIGNAVSHGCIRMRNSEVEWLFDQVPLGTCVLIDNGNNINIAQKYAVKIYY